MTYSIAGGRSFNMVLSHRDKGDPALFGLEEDILGDMKREFQGWDEQQVALCGPLFDSSGLTYVPQAHHDYQPHRQDDQDATHEWLCLGPLGLQVDEARHSR